MAYKRCLEHMSIQALLDYNMNFQGSKLMFQNEVILQKQELLSRVKKNKTVIWIEHKILRNV